MDDLISRDAARNVINTWICNHNVVDRINFIHADLSALPSIDAAPVRHGYWIKTTIPVNTTGHGGIGQDKKEGVLCSECRCAFDEKLLWINDYCPACGARME